MKADQSANDGRNSKGAGQGPELEWITSKPPGSAAGSVPGPIEVWQHLLDGLTEQIALLDEDCNILLVNRSWARTAELYGHFSLIPGTSYLEFCRAIAAKGLQVAREVVAGLEEIADGKRTSFEIIYQASDPERAGNDHRLCVNRFEADGRIFISITRYDITRLVELRRLREQFSNSVIKGQDEERRRLGREIHDSTMQLLASLGMMIGQLRRTCRTGECQPVLDDMEQLLGEAQQEIRSISYLAHPPLLDKMSLTEALRSLVEGVSRRTGLDVSYECVGEPRFRSPAAEGAIYRVVQEALSNVHRHSKARHATVRLSEGKGMAHVVIADDGVGMPHDVHAGVGLAGMRSRLSELDGRLFIRHRSPGTAAIASLPLERRSVPPPRRQRT
nr:sensor histidine kinase [Sphingomonas anseongensis]